MPLTKEQIIANKTKFVEVNERYGVFTKELLEFLGDRLFAAPASTSEDLHNAFAGGLVDHIFKVTNYAVKINNMLPTGLKQDLTSIMKVCLLCEIGKVFLYVKNPDDYQVRKGKVFTYNNELPSLQIGERSAFYAATYGVKLTDLEFQAIVNSSKSDDDKQAKWHCSTLCVILRQAIELAIMEEKNTP